MLNHARIHEHVAALKSDGYSVIPAFIDRALTAALREEVLQVVRETEPPYAELQQSSQYLRGTQLDRLINSEELLRLAGQLCEGPALRFLPFTAVKAPGGTSFQYHQDNQYRVFDGFGVNFWIALDDIDEGNGCLWLVPGSQKLGPLPWVPTGKANKSRKINWNPEDAIPVPARAGDCVIFDRLTIHSSGENCTERHRVAYSITFHREEVSFLDGEDWKPLRTHSRWRTMPTDTFTRFTKTTPGGHR